jgi:signal transduction histidine kinase
MTDLTEVIDLRDRVRLQETMATLGEMAAGLTHELKNSLATIQGFAQLIADAAPESASESAEALVDEVGTLARMVTDFLNFARPQEIASAAVPVVDLVESAAARLGGRFEAAGVELSLEAGPGAAGARVFGDETLLGRALLNLLQNAAEALEAAPPPRRVTVTVLAPGDEVVVEVRDTGPGIPAADLPKIFIPFFTTRSRGYGIGLALTQKIVLAHGGRITAENASPGALFRCTLPAAPPETNFPHA